MSIGTIIEHAQPDSESEPGSLATPPLLDMLIKAPIAVWSWNHERSQANFGRESGLVVLEGLSASSAGEAPSWRTLTSPSPSPGPGLQLESALDERSESWVEVGAEHPMARPQREGI